MSFCFSITPFSVTLIVYQRAIEYTTSRIACYNVIFTYIFRFFHTKFDIHSLILMDFSKEILHCFSINTGLFEHLMLCLYQRIIYEEFSYMSAFSDTLSQYISDKNIKVYSMAKYCDTDRSSMYKFISGKRNPPSDEIIKKMGQFMHLTPLEWQKLKESWDIARIGADVYYKRKSVESFICNFPERPAKDFCGCSFTPDVTYTENRADCISLTSQQHINYYVHQMLLSEADRGSGEIQLFLQPDYKFLFNLLASLNPSGSMKISQIMCVGTETTFTDDHQLINLKYLHSVFPLYMAGHDYSLYYYYDNIESHYQSFNLYPCMILTSDEALLCSSDYQTGIFFRSGEVLRMLILSGTVYAVLHSCSAYSGKSCRCNRQHV